MAPETLHLFTTPEFILGLVAGLTALVTLLLLGRSERPTPTGGVVLGAALILAWLPTTGLPVTVIVGVAILALAGVSGSRVGAAQWPIAVTGAALMSLSVGSDHSWALALVVLGATLLATWSMGFSEHRYGSSTVPYALAMIAFLGVFITVPDTEHAIVAVGVIAPIALTGPPFGLARLGRAGAPIVAALAVWTAAVDGSARAAAVILGISCLGVLLAEPIAVRLSGADRPRMGSMVDAGFAGALALIGIQVAISFAMTAIVRVARNDALVGILGAVVVLGPVGAILGTQHRSRARRAAHGSSSLD